MIRDLRDLANMIGCEPRRIAKVLFKYTDTGISFSEDTKGVMLSGYCEGADLDCTNYHLDYPFTSEEFWSAVDRAETDCKIMWSATHSCEYCWPNGCVDRWGNLFDPGEIGGPVNPDCMRCEGEGTVL